VRKIVGVVLLGLGVFGLVLAVLLPTYVVSHSSKTPLNLNITQVSSGPAKLLDSTTGQTNSVNLRATRIVRTDSHASDSTDTTVDESLCIVLVIGDTPNCVTSADPQHRLLSFSTDRVTADRKSGESVHVAKYNENVNGDTSARHVGLSYKFPINTKKQTYQFYNPDVKVAAPAVFKGTSKIAGLTVYEFESVTPTQKFMIQGIAPGTYDDTRTVWVEPQTGAIIKGVEHQVQTLDGGQVALDTTLTFDQSAIDYQSHYAKTKIDSLNQAKVLGPIVVGVVGLLLIIGAVFLLRSGRGGGDVRHGRGNDPEPTYAESSQT
jgi:Porin PorA